jgi:hypothetical protein
VRWEGERGGIKRGRDRVEVRGEKGGYREGGRYLYRGLNEI